MFVFVRVDPETPLSLAAVGSRVRNQGRGPPWMVVDHSIERILVTSWPGRLLRVRIVDAATDADGAGGLVPDAGYTRAVEIEVVEELPAPLVFGQHGHAVAQVVKAAQTITRSLASECRTSPRAAAAYSAAWNAWLTSEQRTSSLHFGGDHANTLGIPARARASSPIGCGFALIHSELQKHAKVLDGAAACLVDEEGETSLAPPWDAACTALLQAAMALGAPELMDADARQALCSGVASGLLATH